MILVFFQFSTQRFCTIFSMYIFDFIRNSYFSLEICIQVKIVKKLSLKFKWLNPYRLNNMLV